MPPIVKKPKVPPIVPIPEDGVATFTYVVSELPGAQFRAGLAGFVSLLRAGQGKPALARAAAAVEEDRVTVTVDRQSLQWLFDHLYAAVAYSKKVGTTDSLGAAGDYRDSRQKDGRDGGWRVTWRKGLNTTLFSNPSTNGPLFKERAAGGTGKEWAELWEALRGEAGGARRQIELTGGMLLGGQAISQDFVKNKTLPSQVLILRFLPVFLEFFSVGGPSGDPVVLVPDVADVGAFLEEVAGRGERVSSAKPWERASESYIDLPEEAAMRFLHLDAQARAQGGRAFQGAASDLALYGFEVYWFGRGATWRLPPYAAATPRYAAYRELRLACPPLRLLVLRNVLRGAPWAAGLDDLIRATPMRSTRVPDVGFIGREIAKNGAALDALDETLHLL